jgi:hypothetical protein
MPRSQGTRIELYLPPFAVAVVDHWQTRGSKPRRQVFIDALNLLDRTLRGEGDPAMTRQIIQAAYGIRSDNEPAS